MERFEFQTEARQMLDLMIHSVYSNKDIALRELISNGSDALDKRRIESLRGEGVTMPSDPKIVIAADREARTLTVLDNGIGMSRQEIIDNIGTIARSGTREFMSAMKSKAESGEAVSAELIGQFGVGFYAAFMIADRVELTTRRADGDEAWRWVSTGDGTYTMEEVAVREPGTTVTLHLKPDDENTDDYTQEWKIRSIVKQYSDFVSYPIAMLVRQEGEDGEKPDGVVAADGSVMREEQLNSMVAIWRRRSEEITKQEYDEFYANTFYDPAPPLRTIHLRAEGTTEYFALLFIPSRAPYDLFMPESLKGGVHLYVKRVFIMDEARELLPTWLRFLRGIVDSEDLPLNISREILQQNRIVRSINSRLTKKTLETLSTLLAEDRETYDRFWTEFGAVLKEGLLGEREYRESILDVALFGSTQVDGTTTLADYIERAGEGDTIWYITADDEAIARNSPLLEAFRANGREVLILADRVDAVWAPNAPEYRGRTFRSVAGGDIDLSSDGDAKEREESRAKKAEELGPLLAAIRSALDEHVKEVRFSGRLTESPAIVVHDRGDLDPSMERIMRAMGQEVPTQKRILEINADHPVVARMRAIFDADANDPRLARHARILYGGALLADGEVPPDPAGYARMVAEVMAEG